MAIYIQNRAMFCESKLKSKPITYIFHAYFEVATYGICSDIACKGLNLSFFWYYYE